MKLLIFNPARRQQGSAVIVIMVLLGLMLLYVGANLKTLHFMTREIKLIEKHQVRRLETISKQAGQKQKAGASQNPGRPQAVAGEQPKPAA